MVQWADIDWSQRMFASADEAILKRAVATVENAYHNAAGGHSRFPGLASFATGLGGAKTYVFSNRNQLFAATDQGRLFRINKAGTAQDVTGTPISGGKRPIFAAAEDRIHIAAGGPIITLAGETTRILSRQAPDSTHVAYVDGYVLAIEANSQRFRYADPGDPEVWNDLSVFSADGKPDDLNAMVVTPYRELLLAGVDSVEQFERLPNGTQPFARRWATGQGVLHPYTMIADATGTYGVNGRNEFVRFFGQISQDQSDDVDLTLGQIDDWKDAWAAEMSVKGQKFIVLQAPNATNVYDTKGVTLLLDYRNKRWSFLFGWDTSFSRPTRWPGWSVAYAWNDVYVGVPGGIARVDDATFEAAGSRTRFLIRSGHIDKFGPSRIDDVRIRLRRGIGTHTGTEPLVGLRVNRDNLGFDQWTYESMGRPGERDMVIRFGGQGAADTWQWEIAVSDAVPVEFVGMQAYVERLKW